MLLLKTAAQRSRYEVENLRKAKFQTPVQVLLPDQYDGTAMVSSFQVTALSRLHPGHTARTASLSNRRLSRNGPRPSLTLSVRESTH